MIGIVDPCCCGLSNDNAETALPDKKKGEIIEFMSQLPEQLVHEILIRLPSISCCRFKVVCKEWCSLISTNYFNSCYMKHRCQDTSRTFTLLLTLAYRAPTSRYDNHLKVVSTHHDVYKLEKISITLALRTHLLKRHEYQEEMMELKAVASCDDLMLLSGSSTFSVVDLVGSKCRVIRPPVPPVRSQPDVDCGRHPGLLCYHDQDKGNDRWPRFKLILVPVFESHKRHKLKSSRFSIDMYCSETRQWSVVNVKWYPMWLKPCPNGTKIIAHDRMLHWLNGRSLVSVDPYSGRMQHKLGRDVKLPKEHLWLVLGVCGGNIRIVGRRIEEGNISELNVWDLHDNSWLLAHKIVNRSSSSVLAVHPYDTDAIFVMRRPHKHIIYLFNMRTDTLSEYRKLKVSDNGKYGPSLLGQACMQLH